MPIARALPVLAALALAVSTASAHDVTATRFDAPLPLGLLYLGAGATVAATALWLARTDSAERGRRALGTLPSDVGNVARIAASVAGLVVFAGVIAAGVLGRATPTNPAVVVFWVLWLKGVLVAAALAGSPWRALSPWRTVHRLLEVLEGERITGRGYPPWLAEWPATIGFVIVVGVFENLTVLPRSPAATSALLAAYATVMVVGGVVFGREWYRRADLFEVFYGLVGRVAPVTVRERDGRLLVAARRPSTGCARPVASIGVVALVVASVYTVSFDGFTSTPEYQTLTLALRDLGAGQAPGLLVYVAGLLVFLAAFTAVTTVVAHTVTDDVRTVARAVAGSLLPIAVAYELAHNATHLVENAAVLVGTLTGAPPVLLSWLSVPAYWTGQVVLVVAGHLVAVAAAHHVLRADYPRRSLRAHAPLVALMVAYTVLSLWILSRPLAA
ncbi:hypothetical protein [Salarchaeum sp. JOR-1]|uniref:hypothetical protein n=1 Tax=Salarchaeum sp. JOR-1 TaxID=2599399 RepID=UPI001198A427|nr:hypothetical protein [Salarchaeum sp. JOR-1]QDX39462.1 hypothetical protein FQU85_00685 [Salarchaeum sp. JOR-1]